MRRDELLTEVKNPEAAIAAQTTHLDSLLVSSRKDLAVVCSPAA
jgi:hypothetical protein